MTGNATVGVNNDLGDRLALHLPTDPSTETTGRVNENANVFIHPFRGQSGLDDLLNHGCADSVLLYFGSVLG
jgi:hypothetical protein